MNTLLRNGLSLLCLCLLAASAAYAQTPVAPELNLTLGEQRVKFAPTRGFQEMRLEVVNNAGETVFTHTTAEAEFEWNLRAGDGEPLGAGLYSYVLTLKFSEEQSHQHRGNLIVEQGQQQVWLTTQDGATVSGSSLNAARSGGRSLAGFRTSDDKAVKRDVSGRELVDEKGNKLTDDKNDKKSAKQEKAALTGTANMVAKFDASGLASNVVDSAIVETGGNVGIGTTLPNAKLSVSANIGMPPTEVGIIGYFANANENNTFITADSYGNNVVHSDFLFRRARGTMAAPSALLADDIIGQIQARGYGATGFATTARAGIRMTAAENWTNTAQGAYLAFMTNPKLSAAINVERMRITDAGNVGIGTTAPTHTLDVAGTINTTTQYNIGTDRVLSTPANNTFVGRFTGTANTAGTSNTFIGNNAGVANLSGSNNTLLGGGAGVANNSGNGNSFLGVNAGFGTTLGNANTFIGLTAGVANTTGSSNTMVGSSTTLTAGNLTFATAIGSGATATTSNTVVLGRNADTVIVPGSAVVAGNLTISGNTIITLGTPSASQHICINGSNEIVDCTISSIRHKQNVTPLKAGLSEINRLRPVNFTWKTTDEKDFGLIAEEVAEAAPLLAVHDKDGTVKGVNYDKINVVLINAVKEQQAMIQRLLKNNRRLSQRVAQLERKGSKQ